MLACEGSGGGKKLPGKCSSVTSSQGIGGFSWGKVKIACACDGEAGKAEIVMTDGGRSMKMGDKEYKLEPINAVEGGGTQSNPTGFRADGDEPLGAVEVVHPGQVWLKKGPWVTRPWVWKWPPCQPRSFSRSMSSCG